MALFAIADLHLSFGSGKPMDIFGPQWKDHAERLRAVASGLFTFRRKQLAAALRQSGLSPGLEEARRLLEGLAIRPEARAEELPVADFIRIAKALS